MSLLYCLQRLVIKNPHIHHRKCQKVKDEENLILTYEQLLRFVKLEKDLKEYKMLHVV